MQSLIRTVDLRDRRSVYIALTAPIVGYYVLRTLASWWPGSRSRSATPIIASPRTSLAHLSAQDLEHIPYPPDAFPGGRDVDTPYGHIRVYEWGPEHGRKVLLVHGISTPCISLASMAKLLAETGCRVMVFDLFGRGYSDTPDPAAYPQDIRLFTTQILLVLSSSTLDWTGASRFSLVGYSLGGGIGAVFTSYFPHLVDSLVVIAPAGLLRPYHISRSSKLLYGQILPEAVARHYIYRRLKGAPPGADKINATAETGPATAAAAETPSSHPAHAASSAAPLFPDRPAISPASAVAWQIDAHPGFLAAFISSIQHAPITGQHERWRQIGRRLSAQAAPGLREGKVLVLLGKTDGIIVADEVEADATECLGAENVQVTRLDGGHDVPIVNAQGCVDAITAFWGGA